VCSAGAWCQQYVGGQPVMQLQLAQQQAGAQELYANGYADAAAAASSSAKQMAPPRQSSSEYRYASYRRLVYDIAVVLFRTVNSILNQKLMPSASLFTFMWC